MSNKIFLASATKQTASKLAIIFHCRAAVSQILNVNVQLCCRSYQRFLLTMKETNRKRLIKCRYRMSKQLCSDEVIQFLISEDHFNDRMGESIQSKSSNFSKNTALLTELARSSDAAFSAFKRALQLTNQGHLAKMLEEPALTDVAKREVMSISKHGRFAESFSTTKKFPANSKIPDNEEFDVLDGSRKLNVECTDLEFYQRSKDDSYPMKSSPRGLAVIVTLVTNDLTASSSGKSIVDKNNLMALLRQLDYECLSMEATDLADVKSKIQAFANMPAHKNYDSCVVSFFLENESSTYQAQGMIENQGIIDIFSNNKCSHLKNKPKIFLLPSASTSSTVRQQETRPTKRRCSLSSELQDTDDMTFVTTSSRLPSQSDYLVFFLKNSDSDESQHGSFAMQAIIRATAKYAKKKDLTELLTVANEFIRKKSQNSVVEFRSTLCKKLYFYPGISFTGK